MYDRSLTVYQCWLVHWHWPPSSLYCLIDIDITQTFLPSPASRCPPQLVGGGESVKTVQCPVYSQLFTVHSLYNSSSYTSFEPVPAFFCCKLTNITIVIVLVWLRDWQVWAVNLSVNKNNLQGEILNSYIIMIMWGFFFFGKITLIREQEGQVLSEQAKSRQSLDDMKVVSESPTTSIVIHHAVTGHWCLQMVKMRC